MERVISMIHVRRARTTDAPELKGLNDLFNGTDSNSISEIEESLEKNNREIVCVAAKTDGDSSKLVGFCCGQIVKSMCYSILYGDITEFFLLEKYCTQCVGKLLVELMESEFDKLGVNHLHHFTGNANLPVQQLFLSLGYAETSENSYGSPSIVLFEKDSESLKKRRVARI